MSYVAQMKQKYKNLEAQNRNWLKILKNICLKYNTNKLPGQCCSMIEYWPMYQKVPVSIPN